jgi:hypothetical protein
VSEDEDEDEDTIRSSTLARQGRTLSFILAFEVLTARNLRRFLGWFLSGLSSSTDWFLILFVHGLVFVSWLCGNVVLLDRHGISWVFDYCVELTWFKIVRKTRRKQLLNQRISTAALSLSLSLDWEERSRRSLSAWLSTSHYKLKYGNSLSRATERSRLSRSMRLFLRRF